MTKALAVTSLARWTAALLVVSAVLFAIAVALERRGESHEARGAVATNRGEAAEHPLPGHADAQQVEGAAERADGIISESRETAGQVEARAHEGESSEHAGAAHAKSGEAAAHSEERLFGVDLENPWLVWGFFGASLLVALAVLRVRTPALVLTMLLAGVAAPLDLREASMQFTRANSLMAGLALLIALLHLAAVATALLAWRGQVPIACRRGTDAAKGLGRRGGAASEHVSDVRRSRGVGEHGPL